MDSWIQDMYDAFKNDTWKELGELDPNWFEVLTARASLNEGNVADNDDLCANQEGHFKAPLEKTAAESQLFSTPKVFRHSRIVSPDTSFTAPQEKETLPWMPSQSPGLLQPSKQSVSCVKCDGVQPQSEESFDLLETPKKSPANYAKHISESLGAQINPDISWTSSLNTPPACPSTLILSKTDESPCPVSVTADRNVVLVRKLFPSLPNSSLNTLKKSPVSSTSQGADCPVADCCPESPVNQHESHRQHKVQCPVEGEVCNTDGPKTFFANSSSALRKVKPDRVKRKQIIQTNVDVGSHEDESKIDNGASSEEATAGLESGGLPSTPLVKTGDTAISQWSPLSLSEISSCVVGSDMKLQGDKGSDQLTKPSVKISDSGFIRKKRKFVYAVATTKSQFQVQDSEFQKMDPSVKISGSEQEVSAKSVVNIPGAATGQTENQRKYVGETITCSPGTKLQDIDMSQLCRYFAQDFSQMNDLKTAENSQSNFSPAVCLSAMKQVKKKAMEANLPNDYSGISKNKHIPTSNQPCSISERTVIDSGFQSGVADRTHRTSVSLGLPRLENVGQSRPMVAVKTDMHHVLSTDGSGRAKVDAEALLQRSGKGQTLDHGKDIELHRESTSTEQAWNRKQTVGERNCGQPERAPVSLPVANASGFKTASNKGIHISTANLERAKRLFEETEVKETSRDHGTKPYHAVNCKSSSSPGAKKTTKSNLPTCVEKSVGNIISQLTASEKADVTELCTLLEEAESQFDFTQVTHAKLIQSRQHDHNLPQKQDDLDPALLADIDFDDSFSSDGGKHQAIVVKYKIAPVLEDRTYAEAAKATDQYTGMSNLLKSENSSNSLSENPSEDRKCIKLGEPNIHHKPENSVAVEPKNNSTLMPSEAFRTAGGNVLKVSKKCLSKARALFQENNLPELYPSNKQNWGNAARAEQKCNLDSDMLKQDSAFTLKENSDVGNKRENCLSKLERVVCSNKHVLAVGKKNTKSLKNNEIYAVTCESGFRKASGKEISISAKYIQEADAFFKDCLVMEDKEDKNIKALPESSGSRKMFSNLKSPQVSMSKESLTGCTKFENVNGAPIAHHTKGLHLDEVEMKSNITSALTDQDKKSFLKPFAALRPSKSKDLSAFEVFRPGDGFCTAAGKNIVVSAAALRKAESLLNQSHTPEEINKEPNQKEKSSKTKRLGSRISKMDNGGFQTVGGKNCAVSPAALKKASLLGENVKPKNEVAASSHCLRLKIPVTNIWSGGFLAASGKPVVLSTEALEKGKALLGDISLNMDKVADTAPVRSDDRHEKDIEEGSRCGSKTAGGAKGRVPQENLLEEFDDLVLAAAMQEDDALFTDCDLESNNVRLEGVGSKKSDEKPPADQRIRIGLSEEAGKECIRDTDKQENPKENILLRTSCGFKTARGEKVDVSCEALRRAETFLGDCEGVVDKVNTAPPESRAVALPVRNDGFRSASGKPVALSLEALQKAKCLFSEIGLSEDPNTSKMRNCSKNQDSSTNSEKLFVGFTTARGEKVDVLQKNLQKAKVLFKELDGLVSTTAVQEEETFFKDCDASINNEMFEKDVKVHMRGSRKEGLEKCYLDDGMRVNICMEAGSSEDANKQLERKENISPQASGGFQTASGKRVDVSSEALKRAETMFSEFEEIEDKTNATSSQYKATAPSRRNGGFHAASGKPIVPSSEAVQKAKSFFGDVTFSAENPDFSQTRKADRKQDSRNKTEKMCCGFTTARGQKVDVSQKNLQKAKFLFKELDDLALTKSMQDAEYFLNQGEGWAMDCNGERSSEQTNRVPVGEQGSMKLNMFKLKPDEKETGIVRGEPENSSIQAKQTKGSCLQRLSGGFQTASGKTVAVSSEAMSRAKLLLSENKTEEDERGVPSPLFETPVINPALTSGGFFAASGKPVAISSEALQKAKTFFSTGVESFPSAAGSQSDDHEEDKSRFLASDLNTKSCIKGSEGEQRNESSEPKLSSLNLTGCTEIQHKLLAKEALDCTKALLEDEVLAGQTQLMTSENVPDKHQPNSKSAKDDKGRKRKSAEDLPAQPTSKRRLLEEFDRTTDSPRGSGLHPVKSCLNGLTDRAVFRYSTSLHPNITKPNRDAKSFVETRFQRTAQMQSSDAGDGIAAPSKMPVFVPPFIKNTKRDILRNLEARDRKKVPAFVPPFKKLSIFRQESSPKRQEDNNQQHSLTLESNSKTDAPLTEKKTSSEDVLTLVASSNTKIINKSIPVELGSVSSADVLHVDEILSRSLDRTQNIELARDMQDMRIRKKKRQTIRPLPGSLFLTKTSGVVRIPLRAAVNGNNPARYSAQELYECGVHKHVPEITAGNAESFHFSLLQFIKLEALADGGGVQLADGGWLIPSNDWTAGKEEFFRALCDTPGVDPKLISEQWVYNHYRWIVWKQASMEKSFPKTMGSLCLTPEQVLLQLKYRYDVEVDHSCRSALRKIVERDDTPAKTLVLCVCDIVSRGHALNAQSRSDPKTPQGADTKVENPFAVVLLTDGWYAIKAQLDEPLTVMLHKDRLVVGGKLIINGAQLVGSQDACSPLEAPDSLMLKICANSTRRARWDAKLGFQRDPRPFLLPISCLYSNGGPVGCVDIIILRSYPMQWMERKSDGGVVFRSVRAEEKEARRFNSHRQKAVEMLFAKVQAEFEKEEEGRIKPQRRRRTIGKHNIENLQDGEELYEAVGDDPAYLEAHLSKQQLETLQAYRRSLMEKNQAELQDRYRRALEAEDNEMSCPKREVTPVWRLCIADSRVQSSYVYQLNLWRPSSDLQSLLKEGRRFKVYNLVASDGKKRSSVDTVQLTGTKKTQFQELQASQEWLSSRFQQRVSTDFVDLQNEGFKPLCGEVDLTGYVISVTDEQGSSPAFYLVDGKLNFVKVRCFSSLSQAGLEDLLKPRVLLALSNLQLRGQSIYPTPVVYAGDLTAFSTNPKEIHLQESLNRLKNLVQSKDNFFLTAEEKLAHLVKSDGVNSFCSSSWQPQTPVSATERRQDSKTSVTFQKPVKNLGSFTPVSSKLPAATSSTEKDPKSLKRKRALDYLSRIPSPPPISPLGSVVSPCVNKTFNPPRRSGPPSTLKPTQTAAPKPADSLMEDEWVNDEELAMIDTQALHVGNLT